jgi:hypothetical protein
MYTLGKHFSKLGERLIIPPVKTYGLKRKKRF